MSTTHASLHACDQFEPVSARRFLAAIEPLRVTVAGRAADLFAGFQHRRTMDRIARLSNHRLHDMGFERDWDGSVLPRQR